MKRTELIAHKIDYLLTEILSTFYHLKRYGKLELCGFASKTLILTRNDSIYLVVGMVFSFGFWGFFHFKKKNGLFSRENITDVFD